MKRLFDSTSKVQPPTKKEDFPFEVAITGMAGKIASAGSLNVFWDELLKHKVFLNDLSEERANDIKDYLEFSGIDISSIRFKQGSFLQEIDKFDHSFFNISKAEAMVMNPDQRQLLQTVWHALEDAGYACDRIKGTRAGVFIGYAREENYYLDMVKEIEPELFGMALTGNVSSIVAGRIAHFLDISGPTMLINTACSSSMAAIHQAYQSLNNGDCTIAIVGSANVALAPIEGKGSGEVGKLGVESSNGLTRTFDGSSDGTGGGEGCVTLILKPLKEALRDGDQVHAVIKGTAMNHDGSSLNVAAPNVTAQTEVIERAWASAKLDPSTISFIEAHGTGTPIGDPIEISGITNAFRKYTNKKQFCAITAVKSNIGHLDAAAGIAGVVKSVLSLKNRKVAPMVNFEKPNPYIDFVNSPVFVNTRSHDLSDKNTPIHCGVSSFGVSGTNIHIVLGEGPEFSFEQEDKLRLFVISAKHPDALDATVKQYKAYLESTEDTFSDICYTASIGRQHFNHRLAIVASDKKDLKKKIESWEKHKKTLPEKSIYYQKPDGEKDEILISQQMTMLNEEVEHLFKQEPENYQNEPNLHKLANWYVSGAEVSWQEFYIGERRNIVSLPQYQFLKTRCWLDIPVKSSGRNDRIQEVLPKDESFQESSNHQKFESADLPTLEDIFKDFQDYFASAFEISSDNISEKTNIYEIGLDSISIVQVRQLIKKKYGVDIKVADIFKKFSTIGALAKRIVELTQEQAINKSYVQEPRNSNPPANPYSSEVNRSLQGELSAIQNRLQYLIDNATDTQLNNIGQKLTYIPATSNSSKPVHAIQQQGSDQKLTEEKVAYIDAFAEKYRRRTLKSLEFTIEHMPHFANNRNVSGFRKEWKKMQYTIIADRASGTRIWDIDGNEYIDFAMGFGVFLMGHNHQVIRKSIEEQVDKGPFLGPLSKLPGEVASLISELTGVERVAYYNSGTEAIMVAIRLARATTGRDKVVIFAGAYHGMFDGVLAQRNSLEEHYETLPLANGIPKSMVEEVYVLEYDDPNALEFITSQIDEIAAVIVEPVQSRRPELQPKEFLQELRHVCTENETCLIFDEIINGFRMGLGGAQEYFGVRADLVVYGKVVGGGLPLGIVAGKADYLDGIDGGVWDPMGTSLPRFDHRRTIVAGTFCHHPFAMASAKAMLEYLKDNADTLYPAINEMTNQFVSRVNAFFELENVPIRLYNCGSMFNFRSEIDLKFFFYHLIDKGIYVWEGATFFISTVHTSEDIDQFLEAIKTTIHELRTENMMPFSTSTVVSENEGHLIPFTDEQTKIWLKSQESVEAAASLNEVIQLFYEGVPDIESIKKAYLDLTNRHELLRGIRLSDKGVVVAPTSKEPSIIQYLSKGDTPEEKNKAILDWIKNNINEPFPFNEGITRLSIVTDEDRGYIIILVIHQIVADGYSLSLIQKEFEELCNAHMESKTLSLQEPNHFSSYLDILSEDRHKDSITKFWLEEWERTVPTSFGTSFLMTEQNALQGWVNAVIPDKTFNDLKELCKNCRVTPFQGLLAGFVLLQSKLTNSREVIVGIPSIGQMLLDNPYLVGQCMQMLPFSFSIDGLSFEELITSVSNKFSEVTLNRNFSVTQIVQYAIENEIPCHVPEVKVVFNMDPAIITGTEPSEVQSLDFQSGDGRRAKYDLFINLVEVDKQLNLSFQYSKTVFNDSDIRYWLGAYSELLQFMCDYATGSVEEFRPQAISSLFSQKKLALSKKETKSWLDKKQVNGSIHIDEVLLDILENDYSGVKSFITSTVTKEGPRENAEAFLEDLQKHSDFYHGLIDLTERMDFDEGTDLWLLPEELTASEIVGWMLMARSKSWNLHVSNAVPRQKETSVGWVIAGSKETLSSIARDRDVYELNSTKWVVITDTYVTSLFVNTLPSHHREIELHVLTKIGALDKIHFHHKHRIESKLGLKWLSIGSPLKPFNFKIKDQNGDEVAPNIWGELYLMLDDEKEINTNYVASRNSENLFTIWSSNNNEDVLTHNFDKLLITELLESLPSVDSVNVELERNENESLIANVKLSGSSEELTGPDPISFIKSLCPNLKISIKVEWENKELVESEKQVKYDLNRMKEFISCFEEVLGNDNILPEDSYLTLGGSSIKAIHIAALVKQRLSLNINPIEIIRSTNFEELFLDADDSKTANKGPVALGLTKYPLSHSQKRFWIVQQLESEFYTSNLIEARNVYGYINEEVYHQACNDVVRRHQSLRTVFEEQSDTVYQVVKDDSAFDYVFEEWPKNDYRERVLARMQDEIQKPFDLKNGPMLRIILIKLDKDHFITILLTHHIIFDGWSFDVLMEDIITAYKNRLKGEAPFSTPLAIQLGDFSTWHNNLIETRKQELQKFWIEHHQNTSPLNLVPQSKRPKVRNQEGGMVQMIIDEELVLPLKYLAMTNGTSMFMLLYSSIVGLLYCYTGQNNICIGTPMVERENESLQNQIGCFINTLAIRTEFKGDLTVLELLHLAKRNILSAFKHNIYPFDLILNDLNYQRDASRNPLFDVGFAYNELQYLQEMENVDDLGIYSEVINQDIFTVKADVWLHAIMNENKLDFTILYDLKLFSKTFMERFINDFRFVLGAFISNPNIPLDELKVKLESAKEVIHAKRRHETAITMKQKLKSMKGKSLGIRDNH